MGLLDMLLGTQGAAQAAQGTATGTPPPGPPQAAPAPSAAPPAAAPQDVVVTGKRPTAPPPGAGYNNMDEVNALHGLQSQYAQLGPPADAPHTGLVGAIPDAMPGAGTLRNILGTLGDAFLIQSGHQPAYAQRQQREQIANASAGFDTDPGAAAARIAATAAPGSMQDAMTMQQQAQANDLKKATLANTQAYRDSVMGDREQNHAATQAIAQGKADDRTRSLNGGILAAAAATGDQTKYAAARAAALKRIGTGSSIDPSEYPEQLSDFNAGYGLNANQQLRGSEAAANTQQRGQIAQMRNATTIRGQNVGASNNAARVGATYAGQATSQPGQMQALAAKQNQGIPLTPAEQALWTHGTHVGGGAAGGGIHLPPGLAPAGGGGTPVGSTLPGGPVNTGALAQPHPNGAVQTQQQQGQRPQSGPIHVYPSGRKAQWNGQAWVPVH